MRRRLHRILVIAATTAMLSSVHAADFSSLDVDSNGYISAREAVINPILADKWESTDVNMDGLVDRGEYRAFLAEKDNSPKVVHIPLDTYRSRID